MIAAVGGFEQAAKEALNLLKVKWQSSIPEQNYNNGSMQVPVNTQVLVKGRFNRTIIYVPWFLYNVQTRLEINY